MRYDMRADRSGWTVYDVNTGRPVILDDVVLTEISFEDGIGELAEWLSGEIAVDAVEKATEELSKRGLVA